MWAHAFLEQGRHNLALLNGCRHYLGYSLNWYYVPYFLSQKSKMMKCFSENVQANEATWS